MPPSPPLRLRAAVLVLASLAAGCSSQAGPTDEAIARYVGDVESGPDGATAPPPAVRAKRVSVTIERGTGIPDLDPGPGTSDCYVALNYEGTRFKTSVVEGSEAPVWGDSTVFDVRSGGVLEVALFDEDSLSSDEKLGVVTLPVPDLAVGETRTIDVPMKNGQAGTVTLTLTGLARP